MWAPRGIRYKPTEEELLGFLAEKMAGDSTMTTDGTIVDYNVYSCEPWRLPGQRFVYADRQKDMYFFSERQAKSQADRRVSRHAGVRGHWDNKSKKVVIRDSSRDGKVIGFKYTLNYTLAAACRGRDGGNYCNNVNKTGWIMHEYVLADVNHQPPPSSSSHGNYKDLVLCHVYHNSRGTKVAPMIESHHPQQQQGGGGGGTYALHPEPSTSSSSAATAMPPSSSMFLDEPSSVIAQQLQQQQQQGGTYDDHLAMHPEYSYSYCPSTSSSSASVVPSYSMFLGESSSVNIAQQLQQQQGGGGGGGGTYVDQLVVHPEYSYCPSTSSVPASVVPSSSMSLDQTSLIAQLLQQQQQQGGDAHDDQLVVHPEYCASTSTLSPSGDDIGDDLINWEEELFGVDLFYNEDEAD